MIYRVLTPPPGFHPWRRLQNALVLSGRPQALALPPLLVLAPQTEEPRPPPPPYRWVLTPNGWSLGVEPESGPRAPEGDLLPSQSWLLLAWDWGPQPNLPIPPEYPRHKFRRASLELERVPGGLRWRWLDEEPYLLPEGL